MQLPLGFGRLDWGDWLYSLASAFISGGAVAVTAGFTLTGIDPKDFNTLHPAVLFQAMGVMFMASGAVSAANFLAKRSLPAVKQVTTSTQTTTLASADPPVKVVETHTETHTEPIAETKPNVQP